MQKKEVNRSKYNTNTGPDEYYEAATYQQGKGGVNPNLNWEGVPDDDDQLNELLKVRDNFSLQIKIYILP